MAASSAYRSLLRRIAQQAERDKHRIRRFFRWLKKERPAGMTQSFRTAHDEAFAHIDCLQCANCCRTAMAVFEKPDIRRISRHFGMSQQEFIKKYLRPHPDYEYLIRKLPCAFLTDDNRCSIYAIRPTGCRTYPPARLRLTDEQLDVLYDNVHICPAVSRMVKRVQERFAANWPGT
ncbi:MAG: YkgJ family cysteine cluster protein [Chitinophagales bacterium]|nr:YkgJ family cysteine cluster protein [Chitinophagales bacterium]MDW8393708.1 YkgJ family cysteine cluster protein [Chitinophagales bacterium]